MLIKKNKYVYKLTLYSRNQKPFVFLGRKDDVEVSISHKQEFNFVSSYIPPTSLDEYKITLKNINENIAATIYKMFQSNLNVAIQQGISQQINLEVKNRSEKIMLYDVLIDSEFPGFTTSYSVSSSITLVGEFVEYMYA